MKKRIAYLFAALMLAALAACAGKATSGESTAQLPNPFVDCATMEDAAALAGFSMTAPDTVAGYPDKKIQAIQDSLIQVIYASGEDRVLLRKGAGTDDISGDTNPYKETNTVAVGSRSVTMRGDNGKVSVAVWTEDGHAFAVDVDGAGLASEDITALVEAMK